VTGGWRRPSPMHWHWHWHLTRSALCLEAGCWLHALPQPRLAPTAGPDLPPLAWLLEAHTARQPLVGKFVPSLLSSCGEFGLLPIAAGPAVESL
jgi:hypothetical protein